MPSPSTSTAKWKELSEIDYFSLFIKNWLAFNAWYRGHHPSLNTDRDCINEIKTLNSRNSAYDVFNNLMTGSGRESASFLDSLDGLATSLSRVTLSSSKYEGNIAFNNALIDAQNAVYEDLTKTERQHNKITLGTIYVTDDIEMLFKGVIELEYQIRCFLFHGDLEPTSENHQIVKYAYLIINLIMESL